MPLVPPEVQKVIDDLRAAADVFRKAVDAAASFPLIPSNVKALVPVVDMADSIIDIIDDEAKKL